MIRKFYILCLLILGMLSKVAVKKRSSLSKRSNIRGKIKSATRKLEDYLTKAREDIKASSDSDLKVSKNAGTGAGDAQGIIMRVFKPEDAKPVYFNMSPVYDYNVY